MLPVPPNVKKVIHWFQRILGHVMSGVEENSDSMSPSTGVSRSQGSVVCGDLSATVPRGLGGVATSSGVLCAPSVMGTCSSVRSVRFA